MWASEAAAGRRAALRAAVGWQGHCATATTPATSLASNAITRGSSSGSSCEHRIGVGLGSGSSGGGAPSRRCLDVVFSGGDDAVGTRGASSTAGQPTGDRTSSSAVWPSAAWTAQFGGRNGRAQLPARVSPRLPAGATLAATAAAAAPRASPTGASWCLLLHRGLAAPVTKKQQQQQQRENTNPNAIKKKGKPGDAELTPKLARIVEFLLPADQQAGPPGLPARDNPDEFRRRERARDVAQRAADAAWRDDMWGKHALQRAALRALPQRLRAAAEAPDLAPFPLDRQLLFQTPPEAYRTVGGTDGGAGSSDGAKTGTGNVPANAGNPAGAAGGETRGAARKRNQRAERGP